MPVRVVINARLNTPGLDRAERIYAESLTNALDALGRHLQRGLRGRVRRFSGSEQRNIKYVVTGQWLSKALVVFGDLIQLWVDEYGLRPGVFQPWQMGSRIFHYVDKLGLDRRPQARSKARPRLASHVSTRRPGPRRRAAGVVSGPPGGGATAPSPRRRVGRSRRRAAPATRRTPTAERRARAVRRIAFLVARYIYEHGIAARSPIAETFKANRSKILRDVANAFRRATSRINRGG